MKADQIPQSPKLRSGAESNPRLPLRRVIAIGLALAYVTTLGVPGAALADPGAGPAQGPAPVTEWVDVTLNEVSRHRTNPPRAARALALVSVGVQRASARGVPPIHGAAAEVLGHLFPDRREFFDQRAAELASSRSALRHGRLVGAKGVEHARNDRSDAAYTGMRPVGTGYWTEPAGVAGPLEPAAGQWLPWNIPSGAA